MIAFLAGIMEKILNLFYNITNNYGIAIIGMTILIKLVLMPLSYKQYKSLDQMQKIAPEQKRLQEKYKNDKDKLNQELIELYKRNKINPVAVSFNFCKCLLFIFRLLQSFNFAHASFFGFKIRSIAILYYRLCGLTTFYLQNGSHQPGCLSNMNLFMSIFIT